MAKKQATGKIKTITHNHGRLMVTVDEETPGQGSGGGGRTNIPLSTHTFFVEDTPVNRQAYHVGARVAFSIWPALSEMEAAGIL